MKIDNIISKALTDIAETGYTSEKIIKIIKDNFDKVSNDYDFLNVCIDCHYAFDEADNYESDNAINANHSVERLKARYKHHYHLDHNEFSYNSCDCCNSKLGGKRFFYIVFNK